MAPNEPTSRGARLGIEWVWSPLPVAIAEADLALLSPAERARASKFGAARRHLEYVAARAQLRRTLGAALGISPVAVEIHIDAYGKPQSPSAGLQFNLSHSVGGLLIGWGSRPLGVDLEAAARRPRQIERVRIVADVRDALGVDLIVAFTLVEAAAKALGRGIGALRGLRLDEVVGADEVRLSSPGGVLIYSARVPVPDTYAGAVAAPV
ncbi:MAG TPA: hypothetical protein VIZ30_12310 [Pseudomonadales bacterium]